MAAGISTIYTKRRTIPDKIKKLILNALVLSHIPYSATIIQSINQNLILTLDRQLNWAVKASFFRKNFDSSKHLRLKHKILPVQYFLKLKLKKYIWKIKTTNCQLLMKVGAVNLKGGKSTKMKELDSSIGAINSKAQNLKIHLLEKLYRTGISYLVT